MPSSNASSGHAGVQAMWSRDSSGRPLVLVIDDVGPMARRLARLLKRSGLRVETCTSSLGALERIGSGARFDVVVCEVAMQSLDGVGFYVRASAAWPEIRHRMVFVSGGLPEEAKEFIQRECLPFFAKPLDRQTREDLVAIVRGLAIAGVLRSRGTGHAR